MLTIKGDRALLRADLDRLGFGPTAEMLAQALLMGTTGDSFVVGITGRWGSGKSSLLNLTQSALQTHEERSRPHLIEFKPWLVGDRAALLHGLFAELVAGIDQIELAAGDASGVTIRKAESAVTALREFSGVLDGVSHAAQVGADIASPGSGWLVGLVRKFFGSAFTRRAGSLTKAKERVSKRLAKLNRKLIVVIDDLDRLEPAEIVELLRLVRSVADFPNITYLLSYDLGIISHAVEVAAKVEDGQSFIEKIVQVTVQVPHPEAFSLRRWFAAELKEMSLVAEGLVERRIADVVDNEGGRYLVTPRSVVRTLDSIRFHWAVLARKVDVTDFVWLQLIKVGNPALYDWISEYLVSISSRSSGKVHISEDGIKKSRERLDAALKREGKTFADICDRLAAHLPGITSYLGGDEAGIYEQVSKETIDQAIQAYRLSSPDHYRLYFAYTQPVNAPSSSDFQELITASETSTAEVEGLLRQWQERKLTSGVTTAEIMLDRLSSDGFVELSSTGAGNLLMAYANIMDELAIHSLDDFGGPDVWRRAEASVPKLLDALGEERQEVIRRLFSESQALSWLTSIFRRETFAHGRYGKRKEHDKLLSSDDLDIVAEVMLARYQSMGFEQIKEQLQPMQILFAWQQGGDEQGPKDLLEAVTKSDEGLVDTLGYLTGRIQTAGAGGNRVLATLSKSNLGSLIDYDLARARITNLAESATDLDLRARAQSLLENFKNGDHF